MKKTRINQDWQFWKDGNESEKKRIQLPHDAMLLEERDPEMENGGASGYYPGGKYFYAKKIFGENAYKDQSVIMEFEGVYHDSKVFLNGEKVGGWHYGYTNFFVDITEKLRIGEENDLLVETDNSQTPNARWYTGSGIYRPVNLWTGGRVYIRPQGLKVRTRSIHPAVIEIQAECESGTPDTPVTAEVEYTIYDGKQKIAAASGTKTEVVIPDAELWSAENPHLYTIKAVLKTDGNIVDEAETRFGIRTLAWSTEKGLQVNGETVKLRGGCIHHDNGILGARTFDKAERRRIRKLKEFGYNALRYSHYPAGKYFLDACDEMGMYVLDESFDQWRRPKTKYDYSIWFDQECEKDLEALAEKDYSHPSVIMYCIGNEITDTGRSYAAETARRLCGALKRIDPDRPVTIANNAPMSIVAEAMERLEGEKHAEIGSLEINELLTASPDLVKTAEESGEKGAARLEKITGKVFDELDVAGHNYAHEYYEGIHKWRPDRILLSTESFPSTMASNWKWVEECDYCIGDFQWTAWDYLGEAGVGVTVYGTEEAPFAKPYPCLTASCGSFDLTGRAEAAAWYCAALWGALKTPYIGVRPVDHSGEAYTLGRWRLTDALDCWTWDGCEGRKAEIIVYSGGKQVQLFKNGIMIGEKLLQDYKAEFKTTYEPGELEAVSFDEEGKEIGRSVLKTAGREVRLSIEPEENRIKADSEEIVYVRVNVTDEHGILRMMTDKKITVSVEGEGTLLAVGSGRPETEEKFTDGTYTSWHGCVLAVVRSTGRPGGIKITASSEGCSMVCAQITAE